MIDVLHLFAAVTTNCLDNGNVCSTGLPGVSADSGQLRIILQILFGVLGAIAVLMVVIGGFRLVTSDGSPEGVKQGRSTIMYALVGLAIALSAEAIVSFFVGKI